MKLEEAIEIMQVDFYNQYPYTPGRVSEAKWLLIKAGKEVKKAREGDPALDGELLSGETEE